MRDVLDEAREQPRFRPLKGVGFVVLAYVVLCLAYIWTSDWLAARVAQSVAQLEWIEAVKGFAFIVVTAAGLFIFLSILMRRINAQQRELFRQRNALIVSERRAIAGLLASSVGHDINNILMVLRLDVDELTEAQELTLEHRQILEQVTPAIGELAVLAKRLSALAKNVVPGEFIDLDLVAIARDTIAFIRAHGAVRNCTVILSGDDSLPIKANAIAIRQMLVNLIINAAEASEGRGYIEVKMHRVDASAVIEVHDDGPGIPIENRDALLIALRSTKPDGTGLGLLSVKVYAQAHHGRVEIGSSYLGGACLKITLPLHRECPDDGPVKPARLWRDFWAVR